MVGGQVVVKQQNGKDADLDQGAKCRDKIARAKYGEVRICVFRVEVLPTFSSSSDIVQCVKGLQEMLLKFFARFSVVDDGLVVEGVVGIPFLEIVEENNPVLFREFDRVEVFKILRRA